MATYHKTCLECGREYVAKRPGGKFCRPACRFAWHGAGKTEAHLGTVDEDKKVVPLRPVPELPTATELAQPREDDGPVLKASRAELDRHGLTNTSAGQVVLVVAWRLDHSHMETGSGLASLVKAHQSAMDKAMTGVAKVESGDALDAMRDLKQKMEAMVAG